MWDTKLHMGMVELTEEILANLDRYQSDTCIQDIGENINQFTGSDVCLFFIFQPEEALMLLRAVGNGASRVGEVRLEQGEGIAGWVVRRMRPIMFNNVQDTTECLEKLGGKGVPKAEVSGRTKGLIAFPLVSFGKLVGVLEVHSYEASHFSPDDMVRLRPLVNIAAVAVPRRITDESFAKLAEIAIRFLEEKDEYTHGHSLRVMKYSMQIARKVGLPPAQLSELRICSLLHDIGKVILKESLLRKKGRLTVTEYEMVKMHSRIGSNITQKISRRFAKMILSHHERYDGQGYPEGLKGKEIPLVARIICIADSFDAMTSRRPYRRKVTLKEAISEIKRNAGTQFDPYLADAFIHLYTESKLKILMV